MNPLPSKHKWIIRAVEVSAYALVFGLAGLTPGWRWAALIGAAILLNLIGYAEGRMRSHYEFKSCP